MKRHNSIFVGPVRSLEIGDLIAKEFLGGIVWGRVTGIAHVAWQLTDEQKAYMIRKGLEIPENENEPVTVGGSCLVFGDFKGDGINHDQPAHMYISLDQNFAVFPTKD